MRILIAEDEKDLSRISCDMELYDIYAKGFVEGCGGALTDMEIECLPIGAKVMTYECGMRFLTDYLSGDTYFKVDYPTHNLDRTRTQLNRFSDIYKIKRTIFQQIHLPIGNPVFRQRTV